MSYTMPPSGYTVPAPQGGPSRPGTVSLASGLLYLLALISLVTIGLSVYSASLTPPATLQQIFEDAGASSAEAETFAVATTAGIYINAALVLIIGVLYVILGVFVGKGKQWARITSWVIAGIAALCCYGGNLIGTAASGMLSGMGGAQGGVNQEEATKAMEALVPDWLGTLVLATNVVGLVAALAVIVLLLLPPSNPFFRKPEPQWTPPAYPAP